MRGVHSYQAKIAVETELQIDVFANQAKQEIAHSFDDLVQGKRAQVRTGGANHCE